MSRAACSVPYSGSWSPYLSPQPLPDPLVQRDEAVERRLARRVGVVAEAGVQVGVGDALDRAGPGHPARVEADDVEPLGDRGGQPAERRAEGEVDGGVDAGAARPARVDHQRADPVALLGGPGPQQRDLERLPGARSGGRAGPRRCPSRGARRSAAHSYRMSGARPADQLVGHLRAGPPGRGGAGRRGGAASPRCAGRTPAACSRRRAARRDEPGQGSRTRRIRSAERVTWHLRDRVDGQATPGR